MLDKNLEKFLKEKVIFTTITKNEVITHDPAEIIDQLNGKAPTMSEPTPLDTTDTSQPDPTPAPAKPVFAVKVKVKDSRNLNNKEYLYINKKGYRMYMNPDRGKVFNKVPVKQLKEITAEGNCEMYVYKVDTNKINVFNEMYGRSEKEVPSVNLKELDGNNSELVSIYADGECL